MPTDKTLRRLYQVQPFERRSSVPLSIKRQAALCWLAGASLRRVVRIHRGYAFSHESVRRWTHRLGRALRPATARHEVVVIDETSLFTEDDKEVFGWAALDGETKEVLLTWVTDGRSGLDALLFLKNVLRLCSNRPFIQVDRGVWYPWACRTVGVRWKVQRGGMRNHVENWFGSLKWRLRATRRRPGTWHTQTSLDDFMHSYASFWNEGLL